MQAPRPREASSALAKLLRASWLLAAYCFAVYIGLVTTILVGLPASIAAGADTARVRESVLTWLVDWVPNSFGLALAFLPFALPAAALPTFIAVWWLLRSARTGWWHFVMLGSLCPAASFMLLLVVSGDGARLLHPTIGGVVGILVSMPGGGLAALVFWLLAFRTTARPLFLDQPGTGEP